MTRTLPRESEADPPLGQLFDTCYVTDHEYAEFLRHRSVAVVGPAASLLGSNQGSRIDSFDLVIRINRGLEPVRDHSRDIGGRTDIVYNCLVEHPDNGGKIDIALLNAHDVRYICAYPDSSMGGIVTGSDFSPLVNPDTVQALKDRFGFHVVDHLFFGSLNALAACRPNTGMIAIFDLLLHSITRLYITGFTFYLDGFIQGYKPHLGQSFIDKAFNSKRHIQPRLWALLRRAYLHDDRIELDPILEGILGLKTFSREEFQKQQDR